MISFIKRVFNMNTEDAEPLFKNNRLQIETANQITDTDIMKTEDKKRDTMVEVDIHTYPCKENIHPDLVSKSFDSNIDIHCNTELFKAKSLNPQILLSDCLCKFPRLSNNVQKSNANLSDSRRSQRRSAIAATKKISQITQESWQYDETRSSEVKRARSKRSCAKVAETKITKIINMSSSFESDEDDYI